MDFKLPRIVATFQKGEKYRKMHAKEYGDDAEHVIDNIVRDVNSLIEYKCISIDGAKSDEIKKIKDAIVSNGIKCF